MNDLWKYTISTNQWTWVKGSNSSAQLANYGTQGVSASSNVPGASYSGISWTDASGNFWLFGGVGEDASTYGELNDLWKYSSSTNQWTWMKGSGMVDQNGIYGTISVAAASNLPGSRSNSTAWTDASGNLWLLGGFGFDASNTMGDFLNDQWKYNITNNQWTWVNGSSVANQGGAYGTQGVASSTNIPGARLAGAAWKNASTGDFYLFGGIGYFTSANTSDMNDLWKYSPSSNQWTWLNGSNSVSQNGVYGAQGNASVSNIPGSRSFVANWTDNLNNLWLFGGIGIAANSLSYGELNDLWKLNTCIAPSLTISAIHPTICIGQSNTLSISGASSYTWNTNQTSFNIIVSPTITTSYSALGTSSAGCSSTISTTQFVSKCTGIESRNISETSYKFYPNPNNGQFFLSIESYFEELQLLIFDPLGLKVMDQKINSEETKLHTGLQKGVYIFQLIQNNSKIGSGKIIID